MKRLILIPILTLMLIVPASAQSQNSTASPDLLPGNPLYNIQNVVERAEIGLAGLIGGPELKAKAMANNAQKRLAEANALASKNRSHKAAEAVRRYEKTMNKSQRLAASRNNTEVLDKIKNVSQNNVQKLEQVRKKVPQQAQAGIDKAIKNSMKKDKPRLSKNNGRQRNSTPKGDQENSSSNKLDNSSTERKEGARNISKNISDSEKDNRTPDETSVEGKTDSKRSENSSSSIGGQSP